MLITREAVGAELVFRYDALEQVMRQGVGLTLNAEPDAVPVFKLFDPENNEYASQSLINSADFVLRTRTKYLNGKRPKTRRMRDAIKCARVVERALRANMGTHISQEIAKRPRVAGGRL